MSNLPFFLRRCLALLGLLWLGSLGAASPTPEAKEAELKQVQGRIETIRKAIQEDAERRDTLAGQLRKAELDIQAARERLAAVREQRVEAEARLRQLERERSETESSIEQERAALAAEVRVAYANGREEQLKLLLNQQDPARIGRMMAYYAYFAKARSIRITSISEHLAHLELLTEKIGAQTQQLRALEADNARDLKLLAGARARREQTLEQVQSKLQSRNDELTRLQRDARALEQLVEQLRRAIEEFPELAQQPFQRVKGKLPWPIKGPLLARYGQPRAGGPLKWQGLVIAAPRGAQVRSPYHGRVVYADWLPGMGLLLVLDHGGGYMSLYGHNEQLYRRAGDRVSPGDLLSVVGDAPGLGRTGLYLEIRRGREPQDPLAWLAKP